MEPQEFPIHIHKAAKGEIRFYQVNGEPYRIDFVLEDGSIEHSCHYPLFLAEMSVWNMLVPTES